MTAGSGAVVAWSKKIHGGGDRHDWAVRCAELMDRHSVVVGLPAYPSRFASTRQSRDETVRRIYQGVAS